MKYLTPLSTLILLLLSPKSIQAVCPVCTVAVGAGLGLSRVIGIDDSVTGIWIGGLILSSGLWMADFIRKRNWRVPLPEFTSTLLMAIFVIPSLYWSKMIGLPGNALWGIDKVILGSIVGTIVFLLGVAIDKWLRTTNNDKVYIYYQKVIVPIFLLSVISFIFYLITS
ncbi:MAG: hypothetical protein PHX84_02110 [Candidatus Shapirobacteria bacterium]|nr:hypothetical protein [Candidatus Shapirobacteria bacterium]